MSYDQKLRKLREIYKRLIGWFPDGYRARVGEAMLDTFDDLSRERRTSGSSLAFAFGLYSDLLFHLLKENLMAAKESQKLAWISAALLVPFALVFTIGIVWQLLFSLGVVGLPTMWTAFSDTRLAYVLIFLFPVAALLLSLANLILRARRNGSGNVLTMEFAKANVITLSLVITSFGASLFLYGHDVLPCGLNAILSNHHWWSLGPALEACLQA